MWVQAEVRRGGAVGRWRGGATGVQQVGVRGAVGR